MQLADTTPVNGGPSPGTWSGKTAADMRVRLNQRMHGLHASRLSWFRHWQELANYILPRRYKWLVSPNQWNKGSPLNQNIINSVATLAARNCASGIMSGTTSPSRPWFRLTLPGKMDNLENQVWCEEVTKRMMRIMATSNYYAAKSTQYLDLVIFGTAPMLIYEDEGQAIRCFNPAAGEYFCATGPNFDVNQLFREYTLTVGQCAAEFGVDNMSQTARNMLANGGVGEDTEIVIGHAIEPNPEYGGNPNQPSAFRIPKQFKYREVYWERSATGDRLLRVSGFIDKPFSCPRWDVMGNDPYGRSPAMDALGDVKQLQLEERRKAQAIDKMVNPPMVADVSMKNEPASLLPGAVNYVPNLTNSQGFKPAYLVAPQLAELNKDIMAVEARIKDAFFNDLFLMISQLDTVRTATEIDARREEKLIMLGPALDRLQREGLAADIDRIFQIGARRGLFPPPPPDIAGGVVKVEYISQLADVQRASATTAIERLWQFSGGIAAAVPGILDNLDADETVKQYAELMRVPPKILTSKEQVAKFRADREAAQQQAAQMQVGAEAVGTGKVLSETDVGGGQNALQAMLSGGA